ncbi:MAG: four helix bundle protein [Planctomycetes bacterium]|nr:four helix bundle protein [Planctomycetota bacterium]
MATIKRFEDIQGWQKARELSRLVYAACKKAGNALDFGMRRQITGAANSVGANIAEGFGRDSDKDFAHFLGIARGSANEVQSFAYNVLDAGLIDQGDFDEIYKTADEAAALITGFQNYLKGRKKPGR